MDFQKREGAERILNEVENSDGIRGGRKAL